MKKFDLDISDHVDEMINDMMHKRNLLQCNCSMHFFKLHDAKFNNGQVRIHL